MKKIAKYIFMVFVLLLALSGIAALLNLAGESIPEISLSQLVQKINSGEVKEITVRNDKLEIILAGGTKENSKKEFGVGLTQVINDLGVNQEKLSGVEIKVAKENSITAALLNSLPFILP